MTRKRGEATISSDFSSPKNTPRLRLKPKAPTTGYVDGAWWPHSDDLPIELPDLLAVLSVRLGAIDRVIYNLAEWGDAPTKLSLGLRQIRLSGYFRQPGNTIEVVGTNHNKVVLLVVPPRTNPDHAHDTMMAAATRDNAATTDRLLHD